MIYTLYILVVLNEIIHECVSIDKNIYFLFHGQVVCRKCIKKEMKTYLISVSNIAMWLYCSLARSETASLLRSIISYTTHPW